MGPTDRLTKCNYLTIGREVPLTLAFFSNWSGTPIPVSSLVKDLGVQTDNMFSPSAQCTEAASKAIRLPKPVAYTKLLAAHTNACSLVPTLGEVRILINSFSVDMLCVTETWLNSDVTDAEVFFLKIQHLPR